MTAEDFRPCRALSSPTTCRFSPALSGLPTNRAISDEKRVFITNLHGGIRSRSLSEVCLHWCARVEVNFSQSENPMLRPVRQKFRDILFQPKEGVF